MEEPKKNATTMLIVLHLEVSHGEIKMLLLLRSRRRRISLFCKELVQVVVDWWCPGIRTFPKRIQSSLLPPCYPKNINLKLNKENRESYYLSKTSSRSKITCGLIIELKFMKLLEIYQALLW